MEHGTWSSLYDKCNYEVCDIEIFTTSFWFMYILSCINLFKGWEKINKGSREYFTRKYCNIHIKCVTTDGKI